MGNDLRSAIDNLVRAGRNKPAGYTTDAILALVLEEAARVAYGMPAYATFGPDRKLATDDAGRLLPGSPYDRGRYDAAAAIRALADKEPTDE